MYKSFILSISPALFFAQTIIYDDSFAIDYEQSMIIVNQKVNDLNSSYPGQKSTVVLGDKLYVLANSVPHFENGVAYQINHNNKAYNLYFSNLPLIKMTTTGEIRDTPKILGHFEFKAADKPLISSRIGVEYRGATSQTYPKKSMEVEFWLDENGDETHDLALLNLHKGDSYNLQAMYNEKLRINSKTSNELWQQIHPDLHYKAEENDAKSGISMKYVDLFLNGEYRGVYAIGEKVNRKFLKLKKNDGDEIKGELYKGDQWGGATTFTELNSFDNTSDVWDGYEYKHPKDIIKWENLHGLVDYVLNENDETFNSTYPAKFDVDNIVDYFIFLNLVRATDNTGKNIYLAKYKKNGPYFYVPWDLDGTFGSIFDGSEDNTVGDILFNGLYSRLWQEAAFQSKLANRWAELRNSIVTKENIGQMLKNNMEELHKSGVYEREALVWDAYEYEQDMLDYKIDWVGRRIDFLDSVFTNPLSSSATTIKSNSLSIYPNPASLSFYINAGNTKNADLKIIDFSGREIYHQKLQNLSADSQIPVTTLVNGVYFVILASETALRPADSLLRSKEFII